MMSPYPKFSDRNQRIATFRSSHRIGQIVRGRVLRRDPDGFYWLRIEGNELLADLGEAVPEGSLHAFRIEALDPAVILKHLPQASSSSGPGLLHETAALFAEYKRSHGNSKAALSPEHPQLSEEKNRLLELENHINTMLFSDRAGFFRWLPQLFPETGGAECLAIPSTEPSPDAAAPALWQLVVDFEPAPARHGQARILFKYPRASYRLFLDIPASYPMTDRMQTLVANLLPDIEVNCLGIRPLRGRTMKIIQYFLTPQASLHGFFSSAI